MSLTALLSRLSAPTPPGGEPIVRLATPFDRVDEGIGFTSFVFTLTESMAKTFYEIRDVLPPELVGVSVFTLTGVNYSHLF